MLAMVPPKPKIKVVLNITMPPGHLTVNAGALCCVEPRLHNPFGGRTIPLMREFADKMGWNTYVPLTEFGGAKVLASDAVEDLVFKEACLRKLKMELTIHHPPVLPLTVHTDCGAYGYSKAFGFDLQKEKDRLYNDLYIAHEVAVKYLGDEVPMPLYVIGVNGVVEEVSF